MQQIREKRDRFDIDDDTIDVDVLDSLAVTNENFQVGQQKIWSVAMADFPAVVVSRQSAGSLYS
jgi:hypothetical protein